MFFVLHACAGDLIPSGLLTNLLLQTETDSLTAGDQTAVSRNTPGNLMFCSRTENVLRDGKQIRVQHTTCQEEKVECHQSDCFFFTGKAKDPVTAVSFS